MPRIPVNFSQVHIDSFIRRAIPGATDAIFPRFIEENAIFTFPLHPPGLMWRASAMLHRAFTSAVGVNNIADGSVQGPAVRYYHAISAVHNDPVARNLSIEIFDGVSGVNSITLATRLGSPQNQHLPILRPVVVGENSQIRAIVDTIAAGSSVFLRTYSIQQGLAGPLPGL